MCPAEPAAAAAAAAATPVRRGRRAPTPAVALACAALLGAGPGLAACHDGGPASPRHPLAGTYDLATRFMAFSFETAAPSPPDCPFATLYCTHTRGRRARGTSPARSPSATAPSR